MRLSWCAPYRPARSSAGWRIFEIDGGLTHIGNEPLENALRFPFNHERYVLACRADHPAAAEPTVSWAEAVKQLVCLLFGDVQNRSVLNGISSSAGVKLRPQVISSSFPGVASHLRDGSWCVIVPHTFGLVFGNTEGLELRKMGKAAHAADRAGAVGSLLRSPMVLAVHDCAAQVDIIQRFAQAVVRAGNAPRFKRAG